MMQPLADGACLWREPAYILLEMAILTLSLSDELKARVEARAREKGFERVEAYIESMLKTEADAESLLEKVLDYGAPADLSPGTRQELASLIEEGLASPSRSITSADWDRMRPRLFERRFL
jgi:hypothetical protein